MRPLTSSFFPLQSETNGRKVLENEKSFLIKRQKRASAYIGIAYQVNNKKKDTIQYPVDMSTL